MSYTGDPVNNLTDRIRLNVGDTDLDLEGLSDNEYQYVINTNTIDGVVNEADCVIDALKLLVSKYATYVDEKAGGLAVKYSQFYQNYKDLYDRFTKDPRTAQYKIGTPFTGGIYVDEILKSLNDCNTVGVELPRGWVTNDYDTYS